MICLKIDEITISMMTLFLLAYIFTCSNDVLLAVGGKQLHEWVDPYHSHKCEVKSYESSSGYCLFQHFDNQLHKYLLNHQCLGPGNPLHSVGTPLIQNVIICKCPIGLPMELEKYNLSRLSSSF